MVKLATLALGALGAVPALWSGGWFYGKGEIRAQLDAQIGEMQAQGLAASYSSLEIGGFPFAYRGRVLDPKSQGYIATATGPARADWAAPWIDFDSSLGDLGVVNFALPDEQTAQVTPLDGTAPFDVLIRSSEMGGSLSREKLGAKVTGFGQAIEITATSQALASPLEFKAERVFVASSAPLEEPGPVTAQAEITSVTANEGVWGLLDPSQKFPRDPANLRLVANADTVLRQDGSLALKTLNIETLGANIAGLSVSGDGQTVVQNRRPEGAVTLRFSGLGGFIGSAAAAGFLPEAQADLYRVMLDSFAKKGERDGEQVYTIEFKNGFTLVNGSSTFMPAPLLP
jgi:hypothetical protein